MKKIMLIVISLEMSIGLLSQNLNDAIKHHRKYWYYKSRLNNDFLKVGPNQGESFPFMQRGFNSSKFSSPTDVLKIGDGTSILGYYMAVLATELYLLIKNNQNADSTIKELFYALYAFNRVDIEAEKIDGHPTGILNGFFIRDDVPKDFVQNNYDHFNYYSAGINNNTQSRGFMSRFLGGMKTVQSDYQEKQDNPTANPFESKDQVINILYGLAFVKKFVPPWVRYYKNGVPQAFQDGETSIQKEAENITLRIINHLKNPIHYGSNTPCRLFKPKSNDVYWNIRNPMTCDLVKLGHTLMGLSYPVAESACNIINGFSIDDYVLPPVLLVYPPSHCGGNYLTIHNLISLNDYNEWITFISTFALYPINWDPDFAQVFAVNLLSTCNCYLKNTGLYYVNFSGSAIASISYNSNPYDTDHAPLSRRVLNERQSYIPNGEHSFTYLLDVAPDCGIYYLEEENPKYPHYQWSSDNRCDHPNRLGGNENYFPGEYNGIDYLLYHNLWYIYKIQQQNGNVPNISKINNLSHVYFKNHTYPPVNANGYPSPVLLGTPFRVNAYETVIVENSQITNWHHNYIRSGKEIIFRPGPNGETWIKNGTTTISYNDCTPPYQAYCPNPKGLRAYIDNFTCAFEEGSFYPNGTNRLTHKDTTATSEFKDITITYPLSESDLFHKQDYNSLISNYIGTKNTDFPQEDINIKDILFTPIPLKITLIFPFQKNIKDKKQ
jgi:hypothetical protein